jgi:uncharacterized protein YjbI with pentapeptide repeats
MSAPAAPPASLVLAVLLAAVLAAVLLLDDATLLRSRLAVAALAAPPLAAVVLHLGLRPRSPVFRVAVPLVVALAWWRSMPLHHGGLTLVLGLAAVVAARAGWRGAPALVWLALAAAVAGLGWLRTGAGLETLIAAAIDRRERATATCLFRDETPPACARPRVDAGDAPPSPQAAWLAATVPEALRLAAASLDGRDLAGAELGGRDLRRASARDATLADATLAGARLQQADLTGANLAGARLAGAALRGARLDVAGLERADLTGADLAGAALLGARLQAARLDAADLRRAWLWGAELDGARLRGARLEAADLRAARLADADLAGADLRHASLRGARLPGASLAGARLDGALMLAADLRGADWTGATGAMVLHGADLRGARGLTQGQLDAAVGDADTLLPDGPAPDTGAAFALGACWPDPPPEAERIVAGVASVLALDADPAAVREDLICDGRRGATGTPLPFAAERPAGHPLAGQD